VTKRLQVILNDSEYREVRGAARARHMSTSEWVRQALKLARFRESVGNAGKKIEVIRAAVKHEYPVADVDDMLKEIGKGDVGRAE
jgi:hypothetical protein